jgi:hypothetical protein
LVFLFFSNQQGESTMHSLFSFITTRKALRIATVCSSLLVLSACSDDQKEAVSEAMEDTQESVSEAAEATGEASSDAWDKTKEVSADAWDKTKEMAEEPAAEDAEKAKIEDR